ncbi:MAG: hypothetical protein WKF59_04310 [Chitinophagaceae bacterium]
MGSWQKEQMMMAQVLYKVWKFCERLIALGIKPKRTIRAVAFANEENG